MGHCPGVTPLYFLSHNNISPFLWNANFFFAVTATDNNRTLQLQTTTADNNCTLQLQTTTTDNCHRQQPCPALLSNFLFLKALPTGGRALLEHGTGGHSCACYILRSLHMNGVTRLLAQSVNLDVCNGTLF